MMALTQYKAIHDFPIPRYDLYLVHFVMPNGVVVTIESCRLGVERNVQRLLDPNERVGGPDSGVLKRGSAHHSRCSGKHLKPRAAVKAKAAG